MHIYIYACIYIYIYIYIYVCIYIKTKPRTAHQVHNDRADSGVCSPPRSGNPPRPGSMKLTTQQDHISHCRTASGTHGSNGWTYRVRIINTRRDWIRD